MTDYPLPKPQPHLGMEKQPGCYLICPIDSGSIPGWNYSVADKYARRIYVTITGPNNEHTIDYVWHFKEREKQYFYPTYYNEKLGKTVHCDCHDCVIGQMENPDMHLKPEILLSAEEMDE